MRLLIVLLMIMSGTVAFGFWTNQQLEATTVQLLDHLEIISKDISQGSWEAAKDHTSTLENVWQEKGNWWPTIMDHQEMDNIEFTMARFKEYVVNRDPVLSQGEISVLKTMIEHIPTKEALSVKNIL